MIADTTKDGRGIGASYMRGQEGRLVQKGGGKETRMYSEYWHKKLVNRGRIPVPEESWEDAKECKTQQGNGGESRKIVWTGHGVRSYPTRRRKRRKKNGAGKRRAAEGRDLRGAEVKGGEAEKGLCTKR